MTGDGTQVWASRLVGLAVVALFGWLAVDQLSRTPRAATTSATTADAGVSTPPAPTTTTTDAPDAGALAVDPSFGGTDGGTSLELLTLRAGAPKTVKLGVILVSYQGAEGAGTNTRPKAKARDIAEGLVDAAKADFRRAAIQGDPGSSEDIGRIPRGVLDPATEIAVFNLKAGETSGVLETPRGYWIVKRHD